MPHPWSWHRPQTLASKRWTGGALQRPSTLGGILIKLSEALPPVWPTPDQPSTVFGQVSSPATCAFACPRAPQPRRIFFSWSDTRVPASFVHSQLNSRRSVSWRWRPSTLFSPKSFLRTICRPKQMQTTALPIQTRRSIERWMLQLSNVRRKKQIPKSCRGIGSIM